MLTLEKLKEMSPSTIFAQGELIDSPRHCNLANTGKIVRWVAVRGGIYDWAVYAQNPHYVNSEEPEVLSIGYGGVWDWKKIAREGDKIHNEEYIKKLVECNDEAFKMYNH